jgi:Xaa-Pro dipeptidase
LPVTAPLAAPASTPDERPARLAMVRTAMDERGLDALLLSSPDDIYYLTGLNHDGHFALTALIVPRSGSPLLIIREMERPTLAAQLDGCEPVTYRDDQEPGAFVVSALTRVCDGGTVGVDRRSMSLTPAVWDVLRERLPDVRWVDADEVVRALRAVKSDAELSHMQRAAAISMRAIEAAIAAAGPEISEREVAAALYRELIAAGSDQPGVVPLVRSGPTIAHEHVTWSDRRLVAGDTLFIELSAAVARYHAPLSRLVYIARAPDGIERSHAASRAGLEAIVSTLRPGARAGEVYAAWQRAINAALGHDRHRRHHCGYVVGIGFPPSWSGSGTPVGLRDGSQMEIRAGMTFHVFSWILGQDIPDFGTSDTVVVTADGCELLTTTRRDPIVVG